MTFIDVLLFAILITVPLLFLVGIPMYLYSSAKKKKMKFNQLSEEKKAEFKKKENDQIENALTVILPLSIMISLKNSGFGLGEAIFISLCFGAIARLLFDQPWKKHKK
jgi:H+/gluconate symporter-like permease